MLKYKIVNVFVKTVIMKVIHISAYNVIKIAKHVVVSFIVYPAINRCFWIPIIYVNHANNHATIVYH